MLGRKVPFDLLAVVTGLAEDDLIEVLRELVRRGLLVELGDDEFGFRHALAREAISDQLLGRQRRRLHELAYETLAAADDADARADRAPRQGRRPVRRHGRRGASRACRSTCAWARRTRRCSWPRWAWPRCPTTPNCSPSPPGAPGWSVCSTTPTGTPKMCLRSAATADERSGALRLLARRGVGERPARRDGVADRPALRDDRGTARRTRSGPRRWRRSRSRSCCATSREPALRWADKRRRTGRPAGPARRSGSPRWWRRARRWSTTPAQVDAGRALLREVADEAEKAGVWLAKRAGAEQPAQHAVPAVADEQRDLLERMRTAAEKAGFDVARRRGLLPGPGVAGDARRRPRPPRSPRSTTAGGATRACCAPARATTTTACSGPGWRWRPATSTWPRRSAPDLRRRVALGKGRAGVFGLVFHVACRRGDRAAAERAFDGCSTRPSRPQDLGRLAARPGVGRAVRATSRPSGCARCGANMGSSAENWRDLVDAQLAEAERQPAAALAGYQRAMLADDLPTAVRGTAHVGAARCLLALGRRDEAAALLDPAGRLLANVGRLAGGRAGRTARPARRPRRPVGWRLPAHPPGAGGRPPAGRGPHERRAGPAGCSSRPERPRCTSRTS